MGAPCSQCTQDWPLASPETSHSQCQVTPLGTAVPLAHSTSRRCHVEAAQRPCPPVCVTVKSTRLGKKSHYFAGPEIPHVASMQGNNEVLCEPLSRAALFFSRQARSYSRCAGASRSVPQCRCCLVRAGRLRRIHSRPPCPAPLPRRNSETVLRKVIICANSGLLASRVLSRTALAHLILTREAGLAIVRSGLVAVGAALRELQITTARGGRIYTRTVEQAVSHFGACTLPGEGNVRRTGSGGGRYMRRVYRGHQKAWKRWSGICAHLHRHR